MAAGKVVEFPLPPLSVRDADKTLLMYARGATYREIADYLGISVAQARRRHRDAVHRWRFLMEADMQRMEANWNVDLFGPHDEFIEAVIRKLEQD